MDEIEEVGKIEEIEETNDKLYYYSFIRNPNNFYDNEDFENYIEREKGLEETEEEENEEQQQQNE